MKFLTDDGQFGLLVDRVAESSGSRFQLVVGGRLIGEVELSFACGAFEELGNLSRLSDKRLDLLAEDPDVALSALLTEEELHDPAPLTLVEGLDRWLVQGYVYEGGVVILARPYKGTSLEGDPLISFVECAEYASIIELARYYWAGDDERFRSALGRPVPS